MPRTKLVLKLIESEKKRKATYKNRRDGLVQKVSQFATLCGVDAFLICLGPAAAGGEVRTWPPDHRAVLDLIARLRALPPEKIRQVQNTLALLREDLAKQQRALIKVRQCGADELLTPLDCRFDELSLDGLNALHDKLTETLERTQRRMAALRGHVNDNADSLALVIPAAPPHALALPDNALALVDFPFGLSNTGAVESHYYYYPPHDTLPHPVPGQQPYLADQMMPLLPPPPPLAAPMRSGMSGACFMDSNPYSTNVLTGGLTGAPGFLDDHGQIFVGAAAACAGYDDHYLSQGLAFSSGTGYDLEPRMTTTDVWPANTLSISNPMDDISFFQLQNDPKGLLPGSSSGSSLQGGFQPSRFN
ncbi:hypothetical protein GUJ93_ZPchr0007g4582 [Zizania palustris]|uniref:MADS-box domain-containing protein n=1 Tax=Zizania palustris TaxID=103762 RepID=A0A8J5W5V6_ZIZPA|nr:hypothetical protein GUJ93_ZPchr0007g4582 [Zizania palustris]